MEMRQVIINKQTQEIMKNAKPEESANIYLSFSLLLNAERIEVAVCGVVPFKQLTNAISQLILCKSFLPNLAMRLIPLKRKIEVEDDEQN